MQVEWYGQAAFRLSVNGTSVVIDPFGDPGAQLSARGRRWEYPPMAGVRADLLLVTHEHMDHNAVDAVEGDPVTLRSTAGRLDSPVGEVLAVASEHDESAGTERGPNTLFAFTFGGVRVAHLGDLGQKSLRPEQLAALERVDLLFTPVGGGPTIGGEQAARIAALLGARVVVPMHYRTERIDFLDPVDEFLTYAARIERPPQPAFELEALPAGEAPLVVVPAAP